ncbi:MAG: hypothetical protein IJS47_03985 [Clostridia bacterium]|nr:hypothetical protein [Clostridia bacterium]
MRNIIFIVIILPILYFINIIEGGTALFGLSSFLYTFVPLIVLSIIFYNKNLYKFFANELEPKESVEIIKGIRHISIYVSMVYYAICGMLLMGIDMFVISDLARLSVPFEISLLVVLFNLLILLPLEARLRIKNN